MRYLFISATLLANIALADQTKEEIPPPPPLPEQGRPLESDFPDHLEPEITIVRKAKAIHEEYRVNGKLYMIKITPKKGKPYYLIDNEGYGEFTRHGLEPTISIPMWVIKQF
ncbi:MAG: hypothetical protein BMS9Abin36_1933 [Gammaproteobacteria bacterium]|nr:MAG: hypothetical protein BMS9Abin36_1933 [Gammaproteobacteria bacterium]